MGSEDTGADRKGAYGALGGATDAIPPMQDLRTGTLPNGMRYYILPNTMPEGRAYLTLAVDAGSVLEKDDEQGLAHFIEHMAFNGTERFPEQDLLDYLRSLGMRFGADANAYTSFNETVYGIEVPVETDPSGLKTIPKKALEIMDDWSHAVLFNEKDVDDERGVVLSELRDRRGANERILRQLYPILLHGSPYPDRWPIGTQEVLENAPASRLKGFYEKWYRPDNMALICVGDFDGAALEKSLADIFDAAKPATELERPVFELPPPEKDRRALKVITDLEYQFTEFDLYYKGPPRPATGDLKSYRDSLLSGIIQYIVSERFSEDALDPEAPFTGAGMGISKFGLESNFLVFWSESKPDQERATFAALLEDIETIKRYGFTEGEIERAKTSILSALQQAAAEKDRTPSQNFTSQFSQNYLNDVPVSDADWKLNAAKEILPGIKASDLLAALNIYFNANDMTLFAIGPEASAGNLPKEDELSAMIAGMTSAKIKKPEEKPWTPALMDKIPQAGTIVREDTDADHNASILELNNGVRVILQPTKNKNDEIILYAMARGGYTGATVDLPNAISARLATDMANASGLGPYSLPDLQRKLAGKQVSINFSSAMFSRSIAGFSNKADLETLFQMLYLTFTQPKIDESAARAVLDQYRTSLVNQDIDPQQYWINGFRKAVYGDDPRLRPLTVDDLQSVDTKIALDYVKKGLNPADFLFVLSGNIDIEVVKDLLCTYLASVKSIESWNSYPEDIIVRAEPQQIDLYKGKEPQSFTFLGWFVPSVYDYAKESEAAVLSEYLDIKLIEEVREKMGSAYSIGAFVQESVLPPPDGELSLQSNYGSDPDKAKAIAAEVQNQIQLIADGKIDQDSFKKAVAACLKEYEKNMQDNNYIAQQYALLTVQDSLAYWYLYNFEDLYKAVTPESLQIMAQTLLSKKPFQVILYPEESRK